MFKRLSRWILSDDIKYYDRRIHSLIELNRRLSKRLEEKERSMPQVEESIDVGEQSESDYYFIDAARIGGYR